MHVRVVMSLQTIPFISGAAKGGTGGPAPSETLRIFCHKSLKFQVSSIGAVQEGGFCCSPNYTAATACMVRVQWYSEIRPPRQRHSRGLWAAETDCHGCWEYSQVWRMHSCFLTYLCSYQLFVTLSLTSATAERSFSTMRRPNSYLKSTMGESRLRGFAKMSINRDLQIDTEKLWMN